jgi:hypothetical protein
MSNYFIFHLSLLIKIIQMKKLPLKIIGIKSIDIFLNILLLLVGLYTIRYLFGVAYGLISAL